MLHYEQIKYENAWKENLKLRSYNTSYCLIEVVTESEYTAPKFIKTNLPVFDLTTKSSQNLQLS
jgi:hypothetical protein